MRGVPFILAHRRKTCKVVHRIANVRGDSLVFCCPHVQDHTRRVGGCVVYPYVQQVVITGVLLNYNNILFFMRGNA